MNPTIKRLLIILVHILLFPVVFIEYFGLLWFWLGDGTYMFFAVPIFFTVFVILQLYLRRRFQDKPLLYTTLKYSILLLTPILAMFSSYHLANILGIQIEIY